MQVSLTLSHKNTKRFNQFKNHYDRFVDTSATPTYSTLNVGLASVLSSYKYYCSCVYGTKAYFFPYNETRILVIDSTDDSFYFIGNFSGSAKFLNANLAPNGYIYADGNYGSILKFNPNDDTYTTFGSKPTSGYGRSHIVGDKIYMLLQNSAPLQFKVIDTTNDTLYDYFPTGGLSTQIYLTINVGINNCLYLMRRLATTAGIDRLMKVNLTTNTVTYIDVPSVTTLLDPWSSQGTVHPNGKIYYPSAIENRWLIVDTLNGDAISYVNNDTPTNLTQLKSVGSALGANGNIYSTPFNEPFSVADSQELNILTNSSTYKNDSSTLETANARLWYCPVTTPNGNIYCAGFDTGKVLKISFNNAQDFDSNFTNSQWINK